jgi:hypothetical protein
LIFLLLQESKQMVVASILRCDVIFEFFCQVILIPENMVGELKRYRQIFVGTFGQKTTIRTTGVMALGH